jgi:hypothetical protein
MEVGILGETVYVSSGDQLWLLDPAEDAAERIKELGVAPTATLLTKMISPGLASLEKMPTVVRIPLRMGNLMAIPEERAHGWDYVIKEVDADDSLLYTLRGDVSVADVEPHSVAVVGNKYRAGAFTDQVITQPWPGTTSLTVVDKHRPGGQEHDQSRHAGSRGGAPAASAAPQTPKPTEHDIDELTPRLKKFNAEYEGALRARFPEQKSLVDEYISEAYHGEGSGYFANYFDTFGDAYGDFELYAGVLEETTRHKEWSSLEAVPAQVKKHQGVPLTLAQANHVARIADGIKASGGVENEWAAAWAQFTSLYTKQDGAWKRKRETRKHKPGGVDHDQSRHGRPKAGTGGTRRFRTSTGIVETTEGDDPTAGHPRPGFTSPEFTGPEGGPVRHASPNTPDPTQDDIDNQTPKLKRFNAEYHDALEKRFADQSSAVQTYISEAEHLEGDGYWVQNFSNFGEAYDDFQLMQGTLGEDAYKELPQDVIDLLDDTHLLPGQFAFKEVGDGRYRWYSLTATDAWDLQDEQIPPEAIDWSLAVSTILKDRGPLLYRHLPLPWGGCDKQVRAGPLLFESGLTDSVDENPVARAAVAAVQKEPGRWSISPGLRFKEGDLVDGRYSRCWIYERSLTHSPANPTASFTLGGTEMKVTQEMLKEAAEELGLELEQLEALAKTYLDQDKEYNNMAEALKEIATKAAADMSEDEDEEEDEGGKRGKKGDGEDEEDTTEKELRQLIADNTAAMQSVAKALTSMSQPDATTKEDISAAVEAFLAKVPRSDAAEFATAGGGNGDGDPETLQAQLAKVEKELERLTSGQGLQSFEAMFTSTDLNPGGPS